MDVVEYLLFVPLLVYGIALSDLFGQWKRFLDPKSWHLPHLLTLIIVTEIGVYNVFIFFKLTAQFSSMHYFLYWLYLLPPLIFMLLVSYLTHMEENEDVKTSFISRSRPVFLLLGIYIGLHFIPQFHFEQTLWGVRLLGVLICVTYAFWQKRVLFYLFVASWIMSLLSKVYVIYWQ